jgi:hypothetical protein
VVALCRIWSLVFKLSVQCGVEGCVSGLRAAIAELLMMGIKVPETC